MEGAEEEKKLADLPADVVQHILVRLTLAHHIARAAPTCHVVSDAARNAIKVRRFSSEVLPGKPGCFVCDVGGGVVEYGAVRLSRRAWCASASGSFSASVAFGVGVRRVIIGIVSTRSEKRTAGRGGRHRVGVGGNALGDGSSAAARGEGSERARRAWYATSGAT